MFNTIAVYCGAKAGNKPEYALAAQALANYFAENNISLVYGGGKVGLMGEIGGTLLAKGGRIIAVIPHFLSGKEILQADATEIYQTETMHERKAIMYRLSDAMIALPGGFGTMDELFETLTWSQLGLHAKPIGLLNVAGFYDDFVSFLDKMAAAGFLSPSTRVMIHISDNLEDLLHKMKNAPPVEIEPLLREDGI